MNKDNERNISLVRGTEEQKKTVPAPRYTNPIMKKALEFHQEKAGKFKVKDLFTR